MVVVGGCQCTCACFCRVCVCTSRVRARVCVYARARVCTSVCAISLASLLSTTICSGQNSGLALLAAALTTLLTRDMA